MTATKSKRFIHKLQDIVLAYNSTKHLATGVAPIHVGPHNREEIHQRLYLPWREDPPSTKKIAVGDHVRLASYRGAFKRGYTPNWSVELFVVTEKRRNNKTFDVSYRGYEWRAHYRFFLWRGTSGC